MSTQTGYSAGLITLNYSVLPLSSARASHTCPIGITSVSLADFELHRGTHRPNLDPVIASMLWSYDTYKYR